MPQHAKSRFKSTLVQTSNAISFEAQSLSQKPVNLCLWRPTVFGLCFLVAACFALHQPTRESQPFHHFHLTQHQQWRDQPPLQQISPKSRRAAGVGRAWGWARSQGAGAHSLSPTSWKSNLDIPVPQKSSFQPIAGSPPSTCALLCPDSSSLIYRTAWPTPRASLMTSLHFKLRAYVSHFPPQALTQGQSSTCAEH